jgi:NTP pyrophosphatase (non-canonical NTP hydrolase)
MNTTLVNKDNVFRLSRDLHLSAMAHMGIEDANYEVLFLATAFSGEVGELNNLIKKFIRGDNIRNFNQEIESEIADCFAYLFHIADYYGVDMETALINKTSHLYNTRKPDWAQKAINKNGAIDD